ncbi:hypothetical protein [Nonlabens sp.]|uniref:hypothetical protein n=1 Tax=Nonlabens sp. TaxID=1888209 RepID=UPI003267BB1F
MKNLKKIILLLITVLSIVSCTYEDFDDTITKDLIAVDSELYELLTDVSGDAETDEETISCIQVIYPINVFTYNSNDMEIANTFIIGNQAFRDFLDVLPSTNSISISYPISATLTDGTAIDINTNEQLKESIDNCIDEELELIRYCQGLLDECVWEVGYSKTSSNDYLGGSFFVENGVMNFSYYSDTATGSWTSIMIESQLHVNISLSADVDTETQFNRNWKAEILDSDSMRLTDGLDELIIHKYCNVSNDDCYDFNFTKCEDVATPGFTELTLNEYDNCIYEILQEDNNLIDITYYSSEADADTETNPIDSTVPFMNTIETETFFVRVDNTVENTYYIVEISVTVETCP